MQSNASFEAVFNDLELLCSLCHRLRKISKIFDKKGCATRWQIVKFFKERTLSLLKPMYMNSSPSKRAMILIFPGIAAAFLGVLPR